MILPKIRVLRTFGDAVLQSLAGAITAAGSDPPNALLQAACELPTIQHVADAVAELKMGPNDWTGAFRSPARVLHLVSLLNLMRLLGCAAGLLNRLSAFTPSQADAMSARTLLMAQFDSDMLPKRMEPVSNKLRVRQRDALIDYLRSSAHLRRADDLLDYYLIDVEMGACMRTSRIKQAISSVQLYVQRCLLSLERDNALWPVAPHQINAQRWNWMKNYRVWEANRKVFLFPENWIEPELRDDKTEIFKALESDLLQEDLTHERALAAFRNYLESASDIARPVIVAMWAAQAPPTPSGASGYRVHIVARDRATPHKYLYRTVTVENRQDADAAFHWRPWERIDGDFSSGHILVCELDGLPHVLSPSIERNESGQWKIHIEASKRTARGWLSIKKSLDFFTSVIVPGKTPQQSLVLRPSLALGALASTIRVDCFVANVLSGEDEMPDQRGIIDRTDWIEGHQQIAAEIKFRVLDKYKDPANPQHDVHRLNTDRMLYVRVNYRLEWYWDDFWPPYHHVIDEKDTSGPTRHAKFGIYEPANSGLSEYKGGAFHVFQAKLESLIPPSSLNFNHDIEKKQGLSFTLKQITSIEVSVYADPALYTAPVFRQTFDLTNFGGGSIIYDLVCTMKRDVAPSQASSARALDFSYAASFEFDESRALIRRDRAPAERPSSPAALGECEHYGSGFRSLSTASRLRVGDDANSQTVLTTSFNTFFVAPVFGPATSNGIMDLGAYSDSRLILYFLAVNNRWRALPEGQTWIGNGLRALSRQAPDKVDLESLPTDFIQPSPPPIPYDLTAQRLDAANSPKDLALAFDQRLPASVYDWEVFFHVPLMIATQLSQAQRFEEARLWFHTIFDPTSNRPIDPNLNLTAAQWEAVRYWRFPPFRDAALDEQEIDDFLEAYASGALPAEKKRDLKDNIAAWKDNPFNPHLIARFRKRSYMWSVVIKYIQNLVAWGDQQFRRDTIESINEATQLYVLAARILGPRPQSGPRKDGKVRTYAELSGPEMDDLSNRWIELEDRWIESEGSTATWWWGSNPYAAGGGAGGFVLTPPSTFETSPLLSATYFSLYFCVPENVGLTALWDIVGDRLLKIRQCMNIDGVARKLPLFEPPIDPALLVRAAAAGIDISDVLAGTSAPLPLHRFALMLPKAMELCADLRALGSAVLAALEKKDAEELALLRSSHEIALLKLTEQVKQRQIDESEMAIQGLVESRRTAEARYNHYQKLLDRTDASSPQRDENVSLAPILATVARSGLGGREQGLGVTQPELGQLRRLTEAQSLSLAAGIVSAVAGVHLAIGGALSAFRGQTPAGQVDPGAAVSGLGHAFNATASAIGAVAAYQSATAGLDAIIAGYERRRDDWIFQSNMALREIVQIDKQWAAAEIRKEIAEKELANMRSQIENAQGVDNFLKSKYSSAELYRYMSNKLVELYFRNYQLALEVAKRAERCFQFELGQPNASFIEPGYWDSAKKGLLSGEQLHLDLRRMDLAYLESHKREYEITKHVSLMQIDPLALIALRQTGACEFDIPEALYDLDCPGHYMRRIKSVSVTIPCVAGPYAGVHCTLTLLSSSVRKDAGGEDYKKSDDDPRFIDDYSSVQSIVTSGAQADTGLFETNLREERYLPFEGAGADSRWRLELPSEIRQFDYDTISDVILQVRYTARDGGARLKKLAASRARGFIAQVAPVRLFSVRHEFPNEWAKLKSGQNLVIEIKPEHYPFWTRGTGAKTARGSSLMQGARSVSLLATSSSGARASQILVTTIGAHDTTWEAKLVPQKSLADLLMGTFKPKPPSEPPTSEPPASELRPTGNWNLKFTNSAIDDLWIAVDWSVPAHP